MEFLTNNSDNCQVQLYIDKEGVKHTETFPVSLSAQEIYLKLSKKFGQIYIFSEVDKYGKFFPETEDKPSIRALPSEYFEPNETYTIPLFKKIRKKKKSQRFLLEFQKPKPKNLRPKDENENKNLSPTEADSEISERKTVHKFLLYAIFIL